METERLRQTHSKEIESKDEEVEEIRQSCSKKVSMPSWTGCYTAYTHTHTAEQTLTHTLIKALMFTHKHMHTNTFTRAHIKITEMNVCVTC